MFSLDQPIKLVTGWFIYDYVINFDEQVLLLIHREIRIIENNAYNVIDT